MARYEQLPIFMRSYEPALACEEWVRGLVGPISAFRASGDAAPLTPDAPTALIGRDGRDSGTEQVAGEGQQ